MPPRRRAAPKPSLREQREQEAFDALRALLEQAGFDVHLSKTLDSRGGDCLVKGTKRIILSRRIPLSERIELLLDIARREGVPMDAGQQALVDGSPAP